MLATDQPLIPQQHTDLQTLEARSALAKLVMNLFKHWELSSAEQLDLLGLSPKSRQLLSRYSKGEALPEGRDSLDRVGWLLAIHKALRLLYPQNPELRYGWVKLRNEAFNNLTPLDVMKQQGIIGLARVSRYLDHYRGL